MYLHERNEWWRFRYDTSKISAQLSDLHLRRSGLLTRVSELWDDTQNDLLLSSLSHELVSSSAIEGERLDLTEVRSSIARRLGLRTEGAVPSSRYVDGIVEMLLDATHFFDRPLTDERLFGWHAALFPTGYSGLYKIEVGHYRTGEMQIVSGPLGRERVHYVAPSPDRLPAEMSRFLAWVNLPADASGGLLKAAIAHLWFVSIHPFDDGNGRITRAITEMLLARSADSGSRFYSMSFGIEQRRKAYYEILERTQRGDGDITEWLIWFLTCLSDTIETASETRATASKRH